MAKEEEEMELMESSDEEVRWPDCAPAWWSLLPFPWCFKSGWLRPPLHP